MEQQLADLLQIKAGAQLRAVLILILVVNLLTLAVMAAVLYLLLRGI